MYILFSSSDGPGFSKAGFLGFGTGGLTPSLYCMGPKVSEPKKWLVPNFIFKGWEWCIWTITTIIHHQIWSADSTADITVIQCSKLSTLRSAFGRVPVKFFNCSGWNSFNFYMNFLISSKNLDDLDVWPPFWPRLFQHFQQIFTLQKITLLFKY